MGKAKKKQFCADKVLAKNTKVQKSKQNPFEVHVNKQKFLILNKQYKHGRGLPGVSRSKATKRRKETLGQEYKELHKNNKFTDRRFGRGYDNDDDVVNARFVAERMQQVKARKKDLFNLNDEEILTHQGQTLKEIEQFNDDPASDDSEEEALDAEFTEAAHFGGDGGKFDRKTIIEEKIIETKRRKIELAKEKEQVGEMTQVLDQNYRTLISVMGKLSKDSNDSKPKQDDYNRIMREMIFERRGEVTDKLKSEEDILREEKERLERLENERLARMKGEKETETKPTHRSVDALDDSYYADPNNCEEPTLSYTMDGKKSNGLIDIKIHNGCHDRQYGDVDDNDCLGSNKGEITSDDSDDEENEDGSQVDSLNDLKEESESSSEDEKEKSLKSSKKLPKVKSQSEDSKSKSEHDLAYTYDMPESYENLEQLLTGQPLDRQYIIVERIIKCNHPKIDGTNENKMVMLFAYLLQYLNDHFEEAASEESIIKAFQIFSKLCPLMFDLIHMSSEKMSNGVLEVIKEKYAEYKKNPKAFPGLDTVVFLKLVSNLFSTSDFRHSVVIPCFIFISHILARARVKSRKDVAIGLFIVSIYLEYTHLSKRFLPAVLNYLQGMLFLAAPKRIVEVIKIIPPFQSSGPYSSLLVVDNKSKLNKQIEESPLYSKDLVVNEIDDDFKIRILNTVLKIIASIIENLKDNIGITFLVEPLLNLMERIDISVYPNYVKENFEKTSKILVCAKNKKLVLLAAEEKKMKMLRLLEPRIVPVVDEKRRPKLSKKKEMHAIMVHKVKRETKGALREIRRDNAFITKMKIKQQIQSDMERKEKVQRIYAEASVQQGELNALARKKKN